MEQTPWPAKPQSIFRVLGMRVTNIVGLMAT
jgi:hypothetical protein